MASHINSGMARSSQVRVAGLDDVAKITVVINTAFRPAESSFIDQDRITEDEVVELLKVGNFLLTEDGKDLTGCVYVEARGSRAYLGLLSVEPSRQQTGLGSVLMAAADDQARALGCHFIDIKLVHLREDLPAYYKRRGYVVTGTSPFPEELETKVPCHFIDMAKAL